MIVVFRSDWILALLRSVLSIHAYSVVYEAYRSQIAYEPSGLGKPRCDDTELGAF